jgi:hypothetical protein
MSNHGIPPKCRREACEKPAKWSNSSGEWGAYCGNECYRSDLKDRIKYPRFHPKKETKHPMDHGESPKCERLGCENLVKWRAGRWNSYCGASCARIDINRIPVAVRKRTVFPSEVFDNEEDVISQSWLSPLD